MYLRSILPIVKKYYCGEVKCHSLTLSSRLGNNRKMSDLTYESFRSDCKAAFTSAVKAVKPAVLVQRCLSRDGDKLKIHDHTIYLNRPCYVVGFGKAVMEMAIEVEKILGDKLKAGIVSVPIGTLSSLKVIPSSPKIQIFEGAANNLPDAKAEETAQKILKLAEDLEEDDILLVLISGGGSALLPIPLPPVTLPEKLQVIKKLANAGGDILELNCVRKRLSGIKGGKLTEVARPAKVVSLILSDVVGDPLDIIASGPTVPNSDPPSAAWQILCKFGLQESIPHSVKVSLDTVHPVISSLDATALNVLIGNNTIALNEAQTVMCASGYSCAILSSSIQGNVSTVSEFYAAIANEVCHLMSGERSLSALNNTLMNPLFHCQLLPDASNLILRVISNTAGKKGVCVIFGGETTVTVLGSGIGGRNQELALRFAEKWSELGKRFDKFKVLFMSAGTDGIDGPTDAAGAFGYEGLIQANHGYKKFLSNNDSYSFYSALDDGRDLIKIGHTGTNVMDIHMLVIHNS